MPAKLVAIVRGSDIVDGERGWIWAEATGGTNPLGWAPEEFLRDQLLAFELTNDGLARGTPPDRPEISITRDSGNASLPGASFIVTLLILWLVSRLFRRRASAW